jgi:hypothetical protein
VTERIDPDAADRPALTVEVEITPEMIEAGLNELWCINGEGGNSEEELREAAREVYRAMDRARRLSLGASQ